jgi:hypothetical protein
LAGRVLHPLDDRRSFMKLSHPHSLSTRIAWSHYFSYPHWHRQHAPWGSPPARPGAGQSTARQALRGSGRGWTHPNGGLLHAPHLYRSRAQRPATDTQDGFHSIKARCSKRRCLYSQTSCILALALGPFPQSQEKSLFKQRFALDMARCHWCRWGALRIIAAITPGEVIRSSA